MCYPFTLWYLWSYWTFADEMNEMLVFCIAQSTTYIYMQLCVLVVVPKFYDNANDRMDRTNKLIRVHMVIMTIIVADWPGPGMKYKLRMEV